MRALIQRVSGAAVHVEDGTSARIGHGLLIFLGVRTGDTPAELRFVAEKCLNLRIFEDEAGKMNRSVLEIGGEILVVSQFTLYGDTRKGRRPSFGKAAAPPDSIPMYEQFVKIVRESGLRTETGEFGAMMQVELTNDGPVTLLVEKEATE
ncbi:MAG: D-aminoacyl-tRNA deacylase [Verrucomicrobiota bacterium]